jgi:hypothetical protein
MIQGGSLVMPDVDALMAQIEAVLTTPADAAYLDSSINHLIPPNLVSNPDREPGAEAYLDGPDNGAPYPVGVDPTDTDSVYTSGNVQIINISRANFEAAVNGGATLPNNTIYHVTTGCNTGNRRLNLDGAWTLNDIVIWTSCRVEFNNNITFSGSTLYTTYSGGSAAIQGSSGVTLGGGTCDDGTLGSHIIARNGDIGFAAGLDVTNSQIISGADVDIAAQPTGMEGASIMAAGDVRVTSNGEWSSCPRSSDANRLQAYSYRIVY